MEKELGFYEVKCKICDPFDFFENCNVEGDKVVKVFQK